MVKKMSQSNLESLAKIVESRIYSPQMKSKTSIFLCGADIGDQTKARFKFAQLLKGNKRYEVLYPEDVFDDLLAGQGHNLLTLEAILAESVDAIVIFPESPGSLVEIGAFTSDERLRHKIICFSDKKHQKNRSFIKFGPYRLIRASKSASLHHIDYSHLEGVRSEAILTTLHSSLWRLRKQNPTRRQISNILEAENFLLPCIYLVERAKNVELYSILAAVTGRDSRFCEIATKSALSRLTGKGHVVRELEGYSITVEGARQVRESFGSKGLDKARIEIMNFEFRNNSSLKADRM